MNDRVNYLRKRYANMSTGGGKKTFVPFYKKEPTFRCPESKEIDREEYQVLFPIKADDLEQVFILMQGEVWSPNGEARDLITGLGLKHTSMSVGDIVYDVDMKVYFQCDMGSWRIIKFLWFQIDFGI